MTSTPALADIQSEALCSDVYELERHPDWAPVTAPTSAIILIHGWQWQRRCFSVDGRMRAFFRKFRDFRDFDANPKWDQLVDQLGGEGDALAPGVDVLVFRYPTTLSPEVNAARLMRMIEERAEMPVGAGRIVIIAHSMGGLVARHLDALDADRRLSGVVTIGTPHFGSKLADDGALAPELLDSDGLRHLATGVVEAEVPIAQRRARFFAIRGNLPCETIGINLDPPDNVGLFGQLVTENWKRECAAAGYPGVLAVGAGVSDGVVSHASAIPAVLSAASSFAVPNGTAVLHWDLLASPTVTIEATRVAKEYIERGPYELGTRLEFTQSTPAGPVYFGRDFDRAPTVRLVNATGAVIATSGVAVRLELQNAGGAFLTGAQATTQAGVASFPRLRLFGPNLSGPYALIARVEGTAAVGAAVGENFGAYPINTIGAVPSTANPFVILGDSVFHTWSYGSQPTMLWGGSIRRDSPGQLLAVDGASFGPLAAAGDSLFILGTHGPSDVLWKVERDGTGLRAVDSAFTSGAPDLLVVRDALVYVARTPAGSLELRKVPISGGAPSVLTTFGGPGTVLTRVGSDIYFADQSTSSIRRVSIDGGPASPVVQPVPNGATSLMSDGQRIYWTDVYDIWSASLALGVPERFVTTGGNPRVVGLVDGTVYAIHYSDGATLPGAIWRYDATTAVRTRIAAAMVYGPVHVDSTSIVYIWWGGWGSSPLILMSSRFTCPEDC